ncbi:MAG TPA: hypothetical protein VMD97_03190 [Candidatus Aquilonibacter sp.]|nr:hypothetical protein [Candidatus Aquilonibacter sp.]
MSNIHKRGLAFFALAAMLIPAASYGQNFGSAFTHKRIVLDRKLPPTGHIDGAGIKVVVNAVGFQGDVAATLKSDLEDILLRNDPRLRSDDVHPDTIITCTVTSYAQPVPTRTAQQTVSLNKNKPAQPQYVERVTGTLTVGFKAASRAGRSLAADNVKATYDRDFNVTSNTGTSTGLTSSIFHSMGSAASHVTKGGNKEEEEETPPTPIELHDRLIKDAAMQIASHLVNTTEQVTVNLARGGALDEPDKLMENKLYSRAQETLMMTPPFPTPEEDAYRLYDIGVADEALAYTTEDVNQARTYLQQAAINYGKAIDAKPTEKNFLEPQNRIDTALAHYKMLSDESKSPRVESASTRVPPAESSRASSSAGDPPGDAMTNDQVIEMVAAHMDDANIIDNIQHAPEIKFDLSVQGQVYLSQHGVNGRILTAMKTRARGASPAHRASR